MLVSNIGSKRATQWRRRQDTCSNLTDSGSYLTVGKLLERSGVFLLSYCLMVLWAHAAGYKLGIPYGLYQLLDRPLLEDRLWESIFYLHSQPPLFNLMLGGFLHMARATGVSVEHIVLLVHVLFGGVAVLCLDRLLSDLHFKRVPRILVMTLFLASPMLYASMLEYYYTFHELVLLVPLALLTHRYFERQSSWCYLGVCILATELTYTRSLFHFLWSLAVVLCLPWIAPVNRRSLTRVVAVCMTVTACVLLAWPLKNFVLFRVFSYSSWQGINLAYGLPVSHTPIGRVFYGELAPGEQYLMEQTRRSVPARYQSIPALAGLHKNGGSLNWNPDLLTYDCRNLSGISSTNHCWDGRS